MAGRWSPTALRLGGQVEEVIAEDAGPDHVDLEHVDIAGAGGEQLLVEREALGGGVRRRDDLDRVAGLLAPRRRRPACRSRIPCVGMRGSSRGRAGGEGESEKAVISERMLPSLGVVMAIDWRPAGPLGLASQSLQVCSGAARLNARVKMAAIQ